MNAVPCTKLQSHINNEELSRPLSRYTFTILVKKQSRFCILDNPCKAFLEICTCYGATANDVPFVRLDGVQL